MRANDPQVLQQRYRIDRVIEARGLAQVHRGWDMAADLPIEIYLVPAVHGDLENRCQVFERIVKGRSRATSPFLLNLRDAHIDSDGGYYLITERFDGIDLEVLLTRGQRTHPFGALCLAFQVCLALHELHSAGVVHGGLAPRCIRLGGTQTSCKIVDFEFVTPQELAGLTAGAAEGYPSLWPPERCRGAPVSVQQDIYQVGNLVLRLLCGRWAESRSAPPAFRKNEGEGLAVEAPDFPTRLLDELSRAVESRWMSFTGGHRWLDERVRETSSRQFLAERLMPLLVSWLAADPADRPRSCFLLLSTLKDLGMPVVGHLVDPEGIPIVGGLFPVQRGQA